jgi:hypothetical protein
MAGREKFHSRIRLGPWLGAAATAVAFLAMAMANAAHADDRNKTESIVPANAPAGAALNSPNPRAWRVAATSGDVSVVQGSPAKLVKIQVGAFIMPGAKISTGIEGWAVLTHAKDVMAVAAKTKLSLPKKVAESRTTSILQSLGSILFKVDKLPGRKFKVKMPLLVAVVKGATFNVNVSTAGASVSVSEGTVGVSRSQGGGGRSSDVTTGQTASVGATAGGGVSVGRTSPGTTSGRGPDAKGANGNGAGPGKGGGKASKLNGNSGAKGSKGSGASGKSKGKDGK